MAASTVVYTTVADVGDIASAVWHEGVQDSYAKTARSADALAKGPDPIRLIARRDAAGGIQIVQAATGNGEWKNVNTWHLTLAAELLARLEAHQAANPGLAVLRPFIDALSPASAYAARQLVGLQDGTKHMATLQVHAALRALGLPHGDWAFDPILAASA